jgi:hypothetical protein
MTAITETMTCGDTRKPRGVMLSVKNLILEYPPERIINIDETNCRSVLPGFWTWATAGTESVCCRIESDEKDRITVIAGVDAAGAKLPFTIIGKNKIP